MALEREIENDFVKEVKKWGCKVRKFSIEKGDADRAIFCKGGRVCFVEFKRTNKCEPSEHQLKFKREFESLGFKCLITHDIDCALEFVKSVMNGGEDG